MSSDKIQKILDNLGISFQIKEFPESTRTSLDASKAIGCDISQIAKSILFESEKKPILVIASGSNKIDEKKVEEEIGERIKKADAEFVKNKTGYSIGGVSPIGHNEKILTLIDEDLMKQDEIWAAAGTPHSVFKLTPKQLVQITHGKIANLKVSSKNL